MGSRRWSRPSAAVQLTGVTRNGSPVTMTTRTIKGIEYAFIDAEAGSYEASYAPAAQTLIDDTVADFSGGSTGAGTYVSETDDGEVTLKPAEGSEFSGSSLPTGWSQRDQWNPPGGSATVSGGSLTVDGVSVGTDATYGAGRSLEFEAHFPEHAQRPRRLRRRLQHRSQLGDVQRQDRRPLCAHELRRSRNPAGFRLDRLQAPIPDRVGQQRRPLLRRRRARRDPQRQLRDHPDAPAGERLQHRRRRA